jgi:hypothetical protein
MHSTFEAFRNFRSTAAIVTAGVYTAVSTTMFASAIFGRHDGGVWFFMDWIYWPASIVVNILRRVLKNLFSSDILHGFPSPSFSLLNIFDGVSCIVVGAIWYYFLVKLIFFLNTRVKTNKERGVKSGQS